MVVRKSGSGKSGVELCAAQGRSAVQEKCWSRFEHSGASTLSAPNLTGAAVCCGGGNNTLVAHVLSTSFFARVKICRVQQSHIEFLAAHASQSPHNIFLVFSDEMIPSRPTHQPNTSSFTPSSSRHHPKEPPIWES